MTKYHAPLTVKCDQCVAMGINGHASHEIGCPNRNKPWIKDFDLGICRPVSVDDEIPFELQEIIDSEEE